MFRSHDHPQGAYIIPCYSYNLKHSVICFVILILVLWQHVVFLCVSRTLFRMSLVMVVRRMLCSVSLFPLPIHTTCPSHSILLDLIIRIIFGEEYRQLDFLLRSFLNSPVTSSLLDLNILPSTLFPDTLSLRSTNNISDPVSHPYKTRQKVIVLYILDFIFLDSKLEDKKFCAE